MQKVGIAMLNKLRGNWRHIRQIIPYGFGLELKRVLPKLVKDFQIPYIVDSDPNKWNLRYCNIPIVSPTKLTDFHDGDKVLVSIAGRNRDGYSTIAHTLQELHLIEFQDFCHVSQFIPEWYYHQNKFCLYMVDVAVTTSCTLRCRNCNMFILHHKKPIMYTFDELIQNIELLLNRIDYVISLAFLGGEAFLNPCLEDVLLYLGKNWKHKIGSIAVATNGLIIPNQRLLECLKREKVIIAISDYTPAIGDKSIVKALREILDREGITYSVLYNREWCCTGFPEEPWDVSEKDVQQHMLQCNGWRGLNDGKYFFCNIAWSIDKTGLFRLSPGDYIDLEKLPAGNIETKKTILDFSLGNLPNGYMSFCKVCGGCGPDNQNFVLAGEQME